MEKQGLNRRELFQLGAGAVALSTAALPKQAKAVRATGFRIQISPGPPAAPGISIETQPVRFKGKRRPGKALPNSVLLRIPATPEHDDTIGDIKSWVKDAYDGKCIRKDITIEIFDQAGDTVRTFNLIDTFPTHFAEFNADSNASADALHWTLEVRVNRWESV